MTTSGSGEDRRPLVIDVYARISRMVTGEVIKVDDQVEVCTEDIERRGAVVGRVFRDESLSAWKPKVVRPDWDRLMQRLETRQSDGVAVLDLTRFSRKVIEGERLVELAANGARVWAHSGEYDLTTADGRRHFREAVVAAAAESDKISERVIRGKRRKALRGKPSGGSRGWGMPGWLPPGPGWEKGDPRQPVPADVVAAEREEIIACYGWLLGGGSFASLLRELAERDVRTPEGGLWGRAALQASLTRPAVAGFRMHRGQVIGTLAGIEPIVSREEWERMCALLAARRSGRPAGRVHVLSGLIACGRCGMPMIGQSRAGRAYPDGAPGRDYRCHRKDEDRIRCGRNVIDARAAEAIVAEAVKARLSDPRHADRLAAWAARARDARERISAELADLNDAADALAEKSALWGKTRAGVQRAERAMAPLLARIDELTAELTGLDEPEDPRIAAADAIAAWDTAEANADMPALRAMIRRAFPNLTLRPPVRHRGDTSPDRFDWTGQTRPTPAAPPSTAPAA